MSMPSWVTLGTPIYSRPYGKFVEAYVSRVLNGGNSVLVTILNASEGMEPLVARRERFIHGEWRPHPWIDRIEAQPDSDVVTATYSSGLTWTGNVRTPIPSWYPVRGKVVINRDRAASDVEVLAHVEHIRGRSGHIKLEEEERPCSFDDMASLWVPEEIPSPGRLYHQWSSFGEGTYKTCSVVEVVGRRIIYDEVEPYRPSVRCETSLARFLSEFDAVKISSEAPSKLTLGQHFLNLRTNERDIVCGIDDSSEHNIVRMERCNVWLTDVLREWVPQKSSAAPTVRLARGARTLLGTYWGFLEPPTLVEVIEDIPGPSPAVVVRLVGTTEEVEIPARELTARAIPQEHTTSFHSHGTQPLPVGTLHRAPNGAYFYVLSQMGLEHLLVSNEPLDRFNQDTMLQTQAITYVAPTSIYPEDTAHTPPATPAQQRTDTDLEALPHYGSQWVWSSPPALVQALEVDLHTQTIRVALVPTERIEIVPLTVFRDRARELAYRSTMPCYETLLRRGLVVQMTDTLIAVDSFDNESLSVLSVGQLSNLSPPDVINAEPLTAEPPTTLGFPIFGENPGPDLSPTEAAGLFQNILDDLRTAASSVRRDVEHRLVDMDPERRVVAESFLARFDTQEEAVFTEPGPRASVPETIQPKQVWIVDGERMLVARVGQDHEVAWLSHDGPNTSPNTKRIGFTALREQGTFVNEAPLTPRPVEASSDLGRWAHTISRRHCNVLSYDQEKRTARIQWVSGLGEEELRVSKLLSEFRAISPGARDKAVAITSAPGRAAWKRLLDDD